MHDGARFARPGVALLLAAAALPGPAVAGAWTTYLRAGTYGDALAVHDTVWCASVDGGLVRYLPAEDRFERVQREPGGLGSNAVTALALDRSGRLWAGTRDAGVSRLSADGGSWSPVNELDGLPSGNVLSLRAVGDTVLIGTERGVALWNGEEVVGAIPGGVSTSPFASDRITGLVLRGDSLWVATAKGLYVGRPSAGFASWGSVPLFAGEPLTALGWDGTTVMAAANGVTVILDDVARAWIVQTGIGYVRALSDDRGVLVASTDWGIYRWDGSEWEQVPGSGSVVETGTSPGPTMTTLDDDGRLWAANRAGLSEHSAGAWTLHEPEAPVGNNVQNVLVHGSRVYVATNEEGVGRFDGTRWRNWFSGNYQGQTPWDTSACAATRCDTTFRNSAFAFALLVDRDGRKWVGTYDSAVESFDDDVSPPRFVHYTHVDATDRHMHTLAWAAACDTSGGRWFGMDSDVADDPIGIESYGPTGYVANYRTSDMRSGLVRALSFDAAHNNLWVGYRAVGVQVFKVPSTPGGALSFALGEDRTTATRTLDIFGIAQYKDSVWVMSTADVRLFNSLTLRQVGGALPLVGSPAPLGACHPLDVGPDGTVWVGTDTGLHAYRGGGVTGYTVSNSPIAGDVVRAVRVDQATGVVWVGTATGLSRFDPAYVAPAPPPLPALRVKVFPNPVLLTGAGLPLRLKTLDAAYLDAVFRVRVYDAGGRRLHTADVKDGGRFWNGSDDSGDLVRPGIYFVHVEAGGRSQTLRVALLR